MPSGEPKHGDSNHQGGLGGLALIRLENTAQNLHAPQQLQQQPQLLLLPTPQQQQEQKQQEQQQQELLQQQHFLVQEQQDRHSRGFPFGDGVEWSRSLRDGHMFVQEQKRNIALSASSARNNVYQLENANYLVSRQTSSFSDDFTPSSSFSSSRSISRAMLPRPLPPLLPRGNSLPQAPPQGHSQGHTPQFLPCSNALALLCTNVDRLVSSNSAREQNKVPLVLNGDEVSKMAAFCHITPGHERTFAPFPQAPAPSPRRGAAFPNIYGLPPSLIVEMFDSWGAAVSAQLNAKKVLRATCIHAPHDESSITNDVEEQLGRMPLPPCGNDGKALEDIEIGRDCRAIVFVYGRHVTLHVLLGDDYSCCTYGSGPNHLYIMFISDEGWAAVWSPYEAKSSKLLTQLQIEKPLKSIEGLDIVSQIMPMVENWEEIGGDPAPPTVIDDMVKSVEKHLDWWFYYMKHYRIDNPYFLEPVHLTEFCEKIPEIAALCLEPGFRAAVFEAFGTAVGAGWRPNRDPSWEVVLAGFIALLRGNIPNIDANRIAQMAFWIAWHEGFMRCPFCGLKCHN